MNQIEQKVRAIDKAVFASVDYSVPASAMRKTALDGTGRVNPHWSEKDSVRKVVTNALINLGVVYENCVKARLEKLDSSDGSISVFTAQGMNGKQAHENPHKCLCQNLDRTKTYLRYQPMESKKRQVAYVLNGNDITAEIAPWISQPAASGTQGAAGLIEEQVAWVTLDINNIIAIRILGEEIVAE